MKFLVDNKRLMNHFHGFNDRVESFSFDGGGSSIEMKFLIRKSEIYFIWTRPTHIEAA